MSDDLAHSLGAEDYERLRARARAHLRAVEATEASRPALKPPRERRFVRDAPQSSGRERRFERAAGREGPVAVATRPRLRAAPPLEPEREAKPAAHAPRSTPRRVTAPRAYGSRLGSAPSEYGSPYGGVPGRRTIEITGQQRPARRPRAATGAAVRAERFSARPDRIALWAVLLGVFLVLVAIATAHAAVPHALGAAHHLATAR